MRILKVVLITSLIIFGTAPCLSAKDKIGIVFSYGGGLGDYNLSYRKSMDEQRDIEIGFGIYDGKELAHKFPGNLSSNDKPISDF
ncbi:MAG: hypothetical protein PHX78_10260 [bacterium]|nr:hypothetical protein [bacterium]